MTVTAAQLEKILKAFQQYPRKANTVQPNQPQKSQSERLLRLPEIESIVGLRKSSIYALMKLSPPGFPAAVKLSRRAVCWSSSAVEKWVQDRIKAGGQS